MADCKGLRLLIPKKNLQKKFQTFILINHVSQQTFQTNKWTDRQLKLSSLLKTEKKTFNDIFQYVIIKKNII